MALPAAHYLVVNQFAHSQVGRTGIPATPSPPPTQDRTNSLSKRYLPSWISHSIRRRTPARILSSYSAHGQVANFSLHHLTHLFINSLMSSDVLWTAAWYLGLLYLLVSAFLVRCLYCGFMNNSGARTGARRVLNRWLLQMGSFPPTHFSHYALLTLSRHFRPYHRTHLWSA